MGDELAYPGWECSFHTGYWGGEYWYCQEEGCRYRGWAVPMQVASPRADDATGYNGDDPNAGFVADGENPWGDATFGYGGTPAYGEWQGDHQLGSQQDAVGWSDPQNGRFQWHVPQPSPPSPVSATMGSGPSIAQTNSPTSTETFDNEAASTTGNADEDRIGPYVEEQPTVGMDERDDQDTANQAMERIASYFPENRNHDTRRQYQWSYSAELSLSDGSDSGVTQPNFE